MDHWFGALAGRDGIVRDFTDGTWGREALFAGALGELPSNPPLTRSPPLVVVFPVHLFSCSRAPKRELL